MKFYNATLSQEDFSCQGRPEYTSGLSSGSDVTTGFKGDTSLQFVAIDGDVEIHVTAILLIVTHIKTGYRVIGMEGHPCIMNQRKWSLKRWDGEMIVMAEDVIEW